MKKPYSRPKLFDFSCIYNFSQLLLHRETMEEGIGTINIIITLHRNHGGRYGYNKHNYYFTQEPWRKVWV